MNLLTNCSLKNLNTLGIDVAAAHCCTFQSAIELRSLYEQTDAFSSEHLILGGGSNILFTKDHPGWVLLNRVGGAEVVRQDTDHVWVKAGAGYTWDNLVNFAVDRAWGGIENLSFIPGNCGAAPMQNIGAYGAELKDVFEELTAFRKMDGSIVCLSAEECGFGYRESVFKTTLKDQFIILDITLRLNKKVVLNLDYGAIRSQLGAMSVIQPNLSDVRNAVIQIRQSKLPDPAVLGNAGSFFKNPTVSDNEATRLKSTYPDIVCFPQTTGVKLAAGWLIEKVGLKGFRQGKCGVHEQQALVLVNFGGASGNDIYTLSELVINRIWERFGVRLEREVNVF